MDKLYIFKNNTSDIITYIAKTCNIEFYEIYKNEYGKPYFKNINVFFNISHCDDLTVAYVSDREVGIDIERVKKHYSKALFNRVLNDDEKELLKKNADPNIEFTKMWVMKESYVKMLGMGISYGLKNVDVVKLKESFIIIEFDDYFISIILNKDRC